MEDLVELLCLFFVCSVVGANIEVRDWKCALVSQQRFTDPFTLKLINGSQYRTVLRWVGRMKGNRRIRTVSITLTMLF